MTTVPSVLVTPKDGLHYQELLYGELESLGVRAEFDEGPTRSHTVNVILRPLRLAGYRLHGFNLLHIHWIFHFTLPWAKGSRWSRLMMEYWFSAYLAAAKVLGFRVVWTAHDLLPHEPVFLDDRRARKRLLRAADVVIALSESSGSELRELGARIVRVIPMGPYADQYPVSLDRREARTSLGFSDEDVVVSLIGRIEHYKGADILADAAARLPRSSHVRVLLAGVCVDNSYAELLDKLKTASSGRVVTDLRWIPDEDLSRYLLATDVALFPFRAISNSASVALAQSFGNPVVIPSLQELSDIPAEAVIRYDPTTTPLEEVLGAVEGYPPNELAAVAAAGAAWANRTTWKDLANETVAAYAQALAPRTTSRTARVTN